MEDKGRIIEGIKLYDLLEISGILGVHFKTAQKYLRTGKIKGQKIGRKWYASDETLKDFLKGR